MKTYTIGMLYWNSKLPFMQTKVKASNDKTALSLAYSTLQPNHMQTLIIMDVKRYQPC